RGDEPPRLLSVGRVHRGGTHVKETQDARAAVREHPDSRAGRQAAQRTGEQTFPHHGPAPEATGDLSQIRSARPVRLCCALLVGALLSTGCSRARVRTEPLAPMGTFVGLEYAG